MNGCRNSWDVTTKHPQLSGWEEEGTKGYLQSLTQLNLQQQQESARYAQESIRHCLLQPVPSVGSNMFLCRKTVVISLCLFIKYPNSTLLCLHAEGSNHKGSISLCADCPGGNPTKGNVLGMSLLPGNHSIDILKKTLSFKLASSRETMGLIR